MYILIIIMSLFISCSKTAEKDVENYIIDKIEINDINDVDNLISDDLVDDDLINNDLVNDELISDDLVNDDLLDIQENEAAAHTYRLEKYTVEDLVGKWYLLKQDGNIHQSNSYFNIYKDNDVYRFEAKYYGSINHGLFFRGPEGLYTFKYENNFCDYIVGPPMVTVDGKLAILIDSDGPLGFFQKE